MTFNTISNLQQIAALRKSKIQSKRVKEILEKRIRVAQDEICKLRHFANLSPGAVANNCNSIANQIESKLK